MRHNVCVYKLLIKLNCYKAHKTLIHDRDTMLWVGTFVLIYALGKCMNHEVGSTSSFRKCNIFKLYVVKIRHKNTLPACNFQVNARYSSCCSFLSSKNITFERNCLTRAKETILICHKAHKTLVQEKDTMLEVETFVFLFALGKCMNHEMGSTSSFRKCKRFNQSLCGKNTLGMQVDLLSVLL